MATNKKPETKREKFARLANMRTRKILKGMVSLSNLARPNSYDFGEEDVKVINKAVVEQWEATMGAFSGKTEKTEVFTLPS